MKSKSHLNFRERANILPFNLPADCDAKCWNRRQWGGIERPPALQNHENTAWEAKLSPFHFPPRFKSFANSAFRTLTLSGGADQWMMRASERDESLLFAARCLRVKNSHRAVARRWTKERAFPFAEYPSLKQGNDHRDCRRGRPRGCEEPFKPRYQESNSDLPFSTIFCVMTCTIRLRFDSNWGTIYCIAINWMKFCPLA